MEKKVYLETPKFTGRNVPIEEIAAHTGKSSEFLRGALKMGVMHFGYAHRKEGNQNYSFYCPDKLVWEELGYFNDNIGGRE